HADAHALQSSQDVDHLGIAYIGDVFLERHAEDRHRGIGATPSQQGAHAFPRDALTHAVIDASASENDLRMIAGLFGAKGQIVGVNANAVSAYKTWLKVHEIPFRCGGRKHIAGIDAELMKDGAEFIQERDIEIALRIFDNLGSLRDLDRRSAMDARFNNRTINIRDNVESSRVLRGHDLSNVFKPVRRVARIDPLGGIADREIASAGKARVFLQDWQTFFLDSARVYG